jgi:hypothetical protein
MMLIKVLFPGKLRKWIRLPSGRQIIEASRTEVTAILNDSPAIAITSGSKVTMSSKALIRPCHISDNYFKLHLFEIIHHPPPLLSPSPWEGEGEEFLKRGIDY